MPMTNASANPRSVSSTVTHMPWPNRLRLSKTTDSVIAPFGGDVDSVAVDRRGRRRRQAAGADGALERLLPRAVLVGGVQPVVDEGSEVVGALLQADPVRLVGEGSVHQLVLVLLRRD